MCPGGDGRRGAGAQRLAPAAAACRGLAGWRNGQPETDGPKRKRDGANGNADWLCKRRVADGPIPGETREVSVRANGRCSAGLSECGDGEREE